MIAPAPRHASVALLPEGLPEIGLVELNAAAAMLERVDRKYTLSRAQAEDLVGALAEGTRVLAIGGATAHAYSSTYFDTPDLDSYFDAAHPRRRRFKIRSRAYLDSGIAFLEVKTRGPRGRTMKERIPYSLEAAREGVLTDEGAAWALAVLEAAGCRAPGVTELRPVLRGSYLRSTLLMPGGSGRATLDAGLEWEDLRNGGGRLAAPELVIVETKSGSAPSSLDRLLWAGGVRPGRISKYATALAALDPRLPANRWTRALRSGFLTPVTDEDGADSPSEARRLPARRGGGHRAEHGARLAS